MRSGLVIHFRTERFQAPTGIRPVTWHTSWLPQWWGAEWQWNASSTLLMNRESLPDWLPCSTLKVASNQALQYGLQAASSSRLCVADVERHHGKIGLAILRNPLERSTKDDSLLCPS